MKKVASSVSIIGGADGPTSFFIGGKQKKSIKQKLQSSIYRMRKTWIEKHLKAEPHSINEVMDYIKNQCGFEGMNQSLEEYQVQYAEMRTSFILQHAPELLGEYAAYPRLDGRDEESIKRFMEQMELRQKAAESVSKEIFDIDLHIYKRELDDIQMDFIVESKYEYIGGGVSAPDNAGKRQYEKLFRDIHRYYGVSQEDIDNKTERYEKVVRALARK